MPASARPHVGVLLPTREQAIAGDFDARPLLDFAAEAELLGFDSLWAGDSLIARPRLDPLIVLSAVAAVTHRAGLGTAALTPALRHPLIGANMITSLDHVARGRLILGLGSGFPIPETEREFAAVGASYSGRAGRLDDVVALWRQAWRGGEPGGGPGGPGGERGGERGVFTGRYISAGDLDRLPGPARPGGPPLWLAGSDTPAVLRRVARHYDGWLPFLPSAKAYRDARLRIGDLLADAGRPADAVVPGLYATIALNRHEPAARAELETYVRGYYNRSLDDMSEIQAYGWGPADRCAEWISGYVESGARHIVLRIGSLTPGRQLKEIAETVLPAIRR